jgi:hypothetical protein
MDVIALINSKTFRTCCHMTMGAQLIIIDTTECSTHVWDAMHLHPLRQIAAIHILHGNAQMMRRQKHLLHAWHVEMRARLLHLLRGLCQ